MEAQDYIPMTLDQMPVGREFGPHTYAVSKESDEKTKKMLLEHEKNSGTQLPTKLMPGSMWGYARNMFRHFGKVNEVLLAGATWNIHGSAIFGEELTVNTVVTRAGEFRGLPIVETRSEVGSKKGKTIFVSNDRLVLLHEVNYKFYHEEDRRPVEVEPLTVTPREVYFRYEWNETKWRNNIHTRDYARKFGFKEELPEFINYMDWIFLPYFNMNPKTAYSGTRISFRKIFPLYRGDNIDVVIDELKSKELRAQFIRDDGQLRLEARISRLDN